MAADRPDPAARRHDLEQRARTGAGWFYWIAGLSLVNSVISTFAGEWSFVFGLGITQVFDALAAGLADGAADGTVVKLGGLMLSAGALSVYAVFGWFAAKGKTAAFVTGMAFYAVDGLIFLVAGDLVGLGFHVFALALIGRGLKASRELKRLGGADAAGAEGSADSRPAGDGEATEVIPALQPASGEDAEIDAVVDALSEAERETETLSTR